MFEGTLRDNLDPRHVHDDTELWSVLGMNKRLQGCIFKQHHLIHYLDHAKLKEHVSQMEGQLDAQIQEGGKTAWRPKFSGIDEY